MIVVTGAAGFIGSNIIKALNDRGQTNILAVDDLTKGIKFLNLSDCEIMDYMNKHDFIAKIEADEDFPEPIEAVFHEGACSSTTEWDGNYIMNNNYEYSKSILHYCMKRKASFLYASSASVYGGGSVFEVDRQFEAPLNMYGYSKFLFDQYVRRVCKDETSPVVGFRYFNVYGPREQHKGTMSSVAFHFNNQIKAGDNLKLFMGTEGYDNGEQRRDFVYVGDVAKVNLWFLDNPQVSGIFNVGTGRSQSFNDVGNAVINYHQKGSIEYIPFPEHLKGRYQSFTEADLSGLKAAGYDQEFLTVEQGVNEYLTLLNQ